GEMNFIEPDMSNLRRGLEQKRHTIKIWSVSAVILILIFFICRFTAIKAENNLELLESELRRNKKPLQEAENLLRENNRIMDILEAAFTEYGDKTLFSRLIYILAANRPKELWFTLIETNPKMQKNSGKKPAHKRELIIEGLSGSANGITDFMHGLVNQSAFKDVKLVYSKRDKKTGKYFDYKILAGY
ncbi:MAG: PilN domain-containing protein, partial [bacterium]